MKKLIVVASLLFAVSCVSQQKKEEAALQARVEKLNSEMREEIKRKKERQRQEELKYAVPVPNKDKDCHMIISHDCTNKVCCTLIPKPNGTSIDDESE